MRLILWLLTLAYGWIFAHPVYASDGTLPKVKAKSAILVEAETGQILYARYPDVQRPPASMTKVMTALLLIEHCDLDDFVTASKKAVSTGNSSMHLRVGEKIKVCDLLHAILLRSANDGAVAAAEHVAGSVQAFAKMMNEKARLLGATKTHFVNPHGLHHPDHITTARDMAIIVRYAMLNPTFCEIVCKQKAVIERSRNKEDVWMINHAKFLKLYPWADGVKTGYTRQAGLCFAGSATRAGRRLLSVVLNSDDRDNDTMTLMEHGYQDWELLRFGKAGEIVGQARIEGGTDAEVPVVLKRDAAWAVKEIHPDACRWELELEDVRAPVEAGMTIGRAVLRRGEQEITSVPVAAAQAVAVKPFSDKRSWIMLLFVGSGGYAYYCYRRQQLARKRNRTRLIRGVYH
jgi:D-alanyl-D-alanine carboxypeptidase (penicillin-binding protein 5/6)